MVFILLWMAGFALIHSLTADKRTKRAFARLFGERARHGFYRLLYNIVSLITIAPVLLYAAQNGSVIWQVPAPLVPVFIGIQLIGVIGLLMSVGQIDGQRFLGIRQVQAYFKNEPLPLPDEPLQSDGLYAYMRHPLYVFSLLVIWFMPTMTDTFLTLNIGITLYFLIGSRIEERRMITEYGDDYQQYRQQVPWMLPDISRMVQDARAALSDRTGG